MKGKIFISYRRDDSRGSTGRIYDRLKSFVPRDQIFMDVDTIKPGQNFLKIIKEEVSKCNIAIVVIGKNWLEIERNGQRMIDNPEDYVRTEIAMALKRGIPTFPVLVEDAKMPYFNQLPIDLQPLAHIHAHELRHSRFDTDMDILIEELKKTLDEITKTEYEEQIKLKLAEEKQKNEEKTRLRQIEEVKKRKAEEQARITQIKEQRRDAELKNGIVVEGNKTNLSNEKEKFKQPAQEKIKANSKVSGIYIFFFFVVISFIGAFILGFIVTIFMGEAGQYSMFSDKGSKIYWICYAITFLVLGGLYLLGRNEE